jgi:predicted MFS family arabinose efflux permease
MWLLRSPSAEAGVLPSVGRPDGPAEAGTVAQALRTPTFWLLSFGMLVCGYGSAGVVITHLVPHCSSLGLPPMIGATALALIGATNFIGMLVTGHVMDRVGRILPLATLFLIRGVSHVMILTAANETMLLLASAIYGFTHSATMSATAALIGDYFGKRKVGSIYGYMMLGHQVAAAVGAYLGGVTFDLQGNYLFSLVSAGALSVVAAGTSCLLLRGRKNALFRA